MGSPYNYSRFAFPNAPHPTPASTTYTLRPPKPPIHNPYDKFPQSEFDAWIGGITGALRKALGQESERAETPNREVTRDNSIDQDESFVDDSFAEIKARRQDKGKEKESEPGGDARFGAGVGNRDQPIHIDWDAEEVEPGSPVAAPWTVEEEMEAEEVDVIAQGPASPSEAFLVTEGEDSEEEELGDDGDDDDDDDEGQAGPSIVTDIGGDEGVESGSGSSSEGDSVFEVENTVQQPARSSSQVGPPQKYIDVERESSDDDSEMEDDQDEDVIEIDEIDDDEDGNADDEYEEQLDDEAISSPAHISRQPASTEAPVPRADLLLNIESPSVGDSLSPNEARRVGSDSLGAEGEEFLTPGIVTPASLSSNREEGDWAREKQKGFVELDMDADADIMPDVVGGDELIPSSSPTFQQLPILRMLPTDEGPSDLQQSSLAFSSPMEGSVRPLREQLPAVDTHSVEVPPHALDDDLPASSPILSSPVEPEHPQLHADSHGGRVLQAESADDIMDLNGLYDDIYTDPPQEIYELDVGMLEHVVGVVEDEGEEEDSVGPVIPSLMKSSDAEISPNNSHHGDDPAVLADNDEECDELASSHGDAVASKPLVSATGVESERVAGHGPQLIQVEGFDTALPADPPTADRRNVGTPRRLEPLLGFDGQLAQNPTPPIVFEATPLEHESMPLMNSGPSSSPQASHSCDETNTKGPGPFQHSRFLPSPPPDVDSHIPTQRETAIPSDIVDMRDRAAGMLEEIEQGLTSAEEFFIGAASDTIHDTSEKDGSRVSEVGNMPRGAELEIDGVRRTDGHPELLESDVGVELADDVSASQELIAEKLPYAADGAGVPESASRCESNDVRDEIMETCSQVSDAPPDASNADAPDITIEVESPRPNIDRTTTPNSDLVISSPPPNTLLGILPPPITADPNIPDLIFHAETQREDDVGLTQRPQTPPLDVANSERNVATPTRIPLVLSMPSTPAIMLSPVATPGTGRPTPVSVPIPASILMAFQRQKSRGGLATNGLFTPIPSVPTPTDSSQATEVSLHESEAPLQDRHDSSIDLENVKEEPQAQAEPSPPPKLQRQLREEPSIKFEQSSMENAENIPATTPPPTIVSPPLPLASGSVEPAKHDFSCSTTPPPLNQMIMAQKPTHPILYADPYPYSLSTPGAKDALWDGSEADTEHDNSMTSSSTIEKEINDIPELGYPDLSDPEVVETGAVTNDNILDPIHLVEEDTDADGDLDPEFLAHHELANRTAPELEPKSDKRTSPKSIETAIRPAPGSISENANANTNLHTTSVAEILTHPQPQGSSISSAKTTQSHSTLAKKAEARSIADSESSTTSQSTKRKRSPLPYSTRLTRSMSSKDTKLSKKNLAQVNKSSAASSISAKSKGKGKETLNRVLSRKYSGRPESSASSSGASSTYRILRDNSQRASRESSVASTATSDKSSIQIQPSPTVMKPNNIHRPQMVPPPLFHAHTFPRTAVPHHHHPPPSLAQEQLNKQIKSISALDRVPALQAADFARPQPGSQYQSQPQTASSSQPSSSQKAVVYSTSPVTRSNCRYHKISLPLEEGGPRVCFLVPGCSLGDRELMEEEEIEDHGDATHEDSQRIIRDIESLDFDPYLIGILRQLVGVDLLQKQEVFYLPQPGQEPIQRSRPHKSTAESRTSVSSREPGTSVAGAMPSPTSSRDPISISGSAATSISFFHNGSESDEPLSDITDSELDEEDEPAPKRPKLTPLDDPASSISMGPPKASHLKARRSLRLGKEDEVESDLRSENSKPPRARRSQARTNAGGKRSRTSEVTPGEETRHTKRPRTRGAAEEADRSA